jgi:DNA polymerase-3 subunit alpha (Gram-positive type)
LKPEEEFLLRIHSNSDIEPPRYLHGKHSKNLTFSYLEKEIREQIIQHNPAMIADMVETVSLFPRKAFRHDTNMTKKAAIDRLTKKAAQLYQKAYIQPEMLQRLKTEQQIIAGGDLAALFPAAEMAADVLREGGYPIVARGALGSSFAAFLMGITEVNPLPPHQFCRACGYFKRLPDVASGYDSPDTMCPGCGASLSCDGHDIPMETFFGQDGQRQPDICINISERIREKVITTLRHTFGETKILRASAVHRSSQVFSLRNIEAFCKKQGYSLSDIDALRLSQDFSAIRREITGRHSGVYIVSQNAETEDYTPVMNIDGQPCAYYNHPYLRDQLHCLQLPVHDLYDLFAVLWRKTGVNYRDVPVTSEAISLFSSAEKLGIRSDNLISGAAGLPEFGSARAQNMIRQLQPETFSDYVKINALCYSTKAWEENQEELFLSGKISLRELITTLDDIFQMLVGKGMGRKRAYQIMEIVRKGRAGTIFEKSGIEDTVASYLTETQIQILNKIEYLFPKAHAVTYTILAAKAAWYKLHYPMELYQAYLDVSSLPENFLKDVSKGTEHVLNRAKVRKSLGFGCAEEQPYHAIYEVVCEMTLRGYHISNDTDGRIVIKE